MGKLIKRSFLVHPRFLDEIKADPDFRGGTTENRYAVRLELPMFVYVAEQIWVNGVSRAVMKVVDLSQEVLPHDPIKITMGFPQRSFLPLCERTLSFTTWEISKVLEHLYISFEIYTGDYEPLIIGRVSCYNEVPNLPWLGMDATNNEKYGLYSLLKDGLPAEFATWLDAGQLAA